MERLIKIHLLYVLQKLVVLTLLQPEHMQRVLLATHMRMQQSSLHFLLAACNS